MNKIELTKEELEIKDSNVYYRNQKIGHIKSRNWLFVDYCPRCEDTNYAVMKASGKCGRCKFNYKLLLNNE